MNDWKITPDMFGHYRLSRQGDKGDSAIYFRLHEIKDIISTLNTYEDQLMRDHLNADFSQNDY